MTNLYFNNNILFFDSFGYLSNNNIMFILHGFMFYTHELSNNKLNSTLSTSYLEELENFKNRTKNLLEFGVNDCDINIIIDKKTYHTMTDNFGHFYLSVNQRIKEKKNLYNLSFLCNNQVVNTTIYIIDYNKKLIISDIDDTIKDSNVLNKVELLKNTLYRNFNVIKNMNNVYSYNADKYNFCYISGSPWQLYEPLTLFLKNNNFPNPYRIILKKINIININSIINFLDNTRNYKYNNIDTIIKSTKSNIILIGDNTEFDEYVYNDIAMKYPERIEKIYIHQVTGNDILSRFNINIVNKVMIFNNGNDIKL